MNDGFHPYEKLLELEIGYLKLGQNADDMALLLRQQTLNVQKLSENVISLMVIVQELETRLEEMNK